jgi:hypothetical protein
MNNFRENDILILIGAGCSKEAGIPTSVDMIKEIEKILNNEDWQNYRDLYYFVKSSILYADGLKAKYEEPLNIERLVNTLYELEKKDEHPIFPFIGNWNSKVIELCGSDFLKLAELRKKIVKKLKSWVTLENYSKANYYKCIVEFAKKNEFPSRIFSLNYDLCLEKCVEIFFQDFKIELGFDENRFWKWQKFEKNEDMPINIYLYKMHGSINWKREDGFLTFSDEIIQINEMDLIFGTNYKLEYVDPYLFYAYEFRRYSLEAHLLITIGYGFGDEHINGIIGQALRHKDEMKLIVNFYDENKDEKSIEKFIKNRLEILDNKNQIIIHNKKASKFLKNDLQLNNLIKHLSQKTPFD